MSARVADDAALRRAFELQAQACTSMGAPFNGRVCTILPQVLDETSALGRRVLAWPENRAGDLVPLRCCAGFHALARARRVPELVAVYPPRHGDNEALRAALRAAITQEDAFLARNLDSAPQTNEIGRSAILLGGLLTIARRCGMPIALHEIGASAGLNMLFDRWSYDLGDGGRWGDAAAPVHLVCPWTGAPPSSATPLKIASRAACDLNPLDPRDRAARERLLSYIWPDQTERLIRSIAAFEVAAASDLVVDKDEARSWVAKRLGHGSTKPGTATVLFHSVFIQYLTPHARAALIAEIVACGGRATADAPVAWLRMEAAAGNPAQCELRLTFWPGAEDSHLANVDWHGRSARWV